MFNITLEPCEDINCLKAMEYLAMGWKPYADHDERMLDESREYTRCPFNDKKPRVISWDQEEYFDKMHKGLAALQCLIRTKKIKMYTNFITSYGFPLEMIDTKDLISDEKLSMIEKEQPLSVFLKFEEIYDRGKYQILFGGNGEDDYNIVVEVKNKLGVFYYHNVKLKFSEIEQYYKPDDIPQDKEETVSSKNQELKKYEGYTTPHMEIMFEVIEENNLSHTNQGNVESLKAHILEKLKKRGLRESGKIAEAMSTIIRLPEAQTGTVYHSKKEKKQKMG